jgi:hypothetical protein
LRTSRGDHAANYLRVIGTPIPQDVDVLHSIVIAYEHRFGVVTSDDYEFELVAPRAWIDALVADRRFSGPTSPNDPWVEPRVKQRTKSPIREWYRPAPLDAFTAYVSQTSVVYDLLLVEKTARSDGRLHVFLGKR